jgi:hypothetical protein
MMMIIIIIIIIIITTIIIIIIDLLGYKSVQEENVYFEFEFELLVESVFM